MVEDNSLELACPSDLSVYNLEDDSAVACEEPDPTKVNNGNFVFKNSNGIHIGDKTYYTAPVTIKQFVVPNVNTIKDGQEIPDILGTLPIKFTTELSDGKDTPADENCWEFSRRWLKVPRNMAIAVSTSALVFALIFTIIYFSIGSKKDAEVVLPTNSSLRIRSKGDWLGLPEKMRSPLKVNPPHFVMIAHTVSSNCSTPPTCAAVVRNIQAGHLALGWEDIGYNFLVGGDGYAYEGRGWAAKGSHTIPFNSYSIGIAFVGNFMVNPPPKRQIDAAFIVMAEGVRLGFLPPDYKILFHKQIMASESPGAALIEEIRKWPHWTACDDECLQILAQNN